MRAATMLRGLGEWGMGLAALGVVLGVVAGPVWILGQLPAPPYPDGLRHEPEPCPGAPVKTPHGPGVLVRPIRYGDGPRWQVRLETGRYVVLYRAQFHVKGGDGACDGDP